MLNGSAGPGHLTFVCVLPALCGNIIGGTGLFTLLAHTRSFAELDDTGEPAGQEEPRRPRGEATRLERPGHWRVP